MANKTTSVITLTIDITETDLDKLADFFETNLQTFGAFSEVSSLDCIKGLREVSQAVADLYDYSGGIGLDETPHPDLIQERICETYQLSCKILDGDNDG